MKWCPSDFWASPCRILGICFCWIYLTSFWFDCTTILWVQLITILVFGRFCLQKVWDPLLELLCLTLCYGAVWYMGWEGRGVLVLFLCPPCFRKGHLPPLPLPPPFLPSSLFPLLSPSLLFRFRVKAAHHGCSCLMVVSIVIRRWRWSATCSIYHVWEVCRHWAIVWYFVLFSIVNVPRQDVETLFPGSLSLFWASLLAQVSCKDW